MAFAEKVALFWSRVDQTGDCWVWTRGHASDGYGAFALGDESERTHRVAWIVTNGPVPKGLCVLHRCDNRLCVRPDHLFLGTRAVNNRDRAEKGRSATGGTHGTHVHPESYRGERQSKAKLTEDDVRAIRASTDTTVSLARRFNVSRRTVRAVLDGTNWGWLS